MLYPHRVCRAVRADMLVAETISAPAARVKRRLLWLRVVPLLLLAAWLGARGLTAVAMWYGEYWSLYGAGGTRDGPYSLAQAVDSVATSSHERRPAFYCLIRSVWGRA